SSAGEMNVGSEGYQCIMQSRTHVSEMLRIAESPRTASRQRPPDPRAEAKEGDDRQRTRSKVTAGGRRAITGKPGHDKRQRNRDHHDHDNPGDRGDDRGGDSKKTSLQHDYDVRLDTAHRDSHPDRMWRWRRHTGFRLSVTEPSAFYGSIVTDCIRC